MCCVFLWTTYFYSCPEQIISGAAVVFSINREECGCGLCPVGEALFLYSSSIGTPFVVLRGQLRIAIFHPLDPLRP